MDGERGRVVRLFVSSTFDDFRHEREHLQAEVFPRLAEKCRGSGVGFEVVPNEISKEVLGAITHRLEANGRSAATDPLRRFGSSPGTSRRPNAH